MVSSSLVPTTVTFIVYPIETVGIQHLALRERDAGAPEASGLLRPTQAPPRAATPGPQIRLYGAVGKAIVIPTQLSAN